MHQPFSINAYPVLSLPALPTQSSRQLLRRSSEGGLGSYEPPPYPGSAAVASGIRASTATGVFDPLLAGGNNVAAAARRAHSSMSGRLMGGVGTGVGSMMGARSWHPSPFVSDDDASASDEPQFYKEEKKNRIKMEIARRRQQIEENACLHEELTRLAKLRETAELGTGTTGGLMGGATAAGMTGLGGVVGGLGGHNVPLTGMGVNSPATLASRLTSTAVAGNPHHLGTTTTGGGVMMDGLGGVGSAVAASAASANSVLKSVDEILRDGTGTTAGLGVGGLGLGGTVADPLGISTATSSAALGGLSSSYRTSAAGRNPLTTSTLVDGHVPGLGTTTAAAGLSSALNPDLYTASAYERTIDFSPMNSELSDFTGGHRGVGVRGLGAATNAATSTLLPNSIPSVGGVTAGLTDGILSADPYGKYSKHSAAVTSAFK